MRMQIKIALVLVMIVLTGGNIFSGSSPYPDNTESVISFTGTLSNSSFSINDVVSRFGNFQPGDAEVVSSEYVSSAGFVATRGNACWL